MKKELGTVIAETRKQRGMTQLELAEKMGVTDKAVSKWERGLSCPDISSLPRLSQVLGIGIDELMQSGNAEGKPKSRAAAIGDTACKAVALAMGIAVLCLTVLNKLDPTGAISMLSIGLIGISISLLKKE